MATATRLQGCGSGWNFYARTFFSALALEPKLLQDLRASNRQSRTRHGHGSPGSLDSPVNGGDSVTACSRTLQGGEGARRNNAADAALHAGGRRPYVVITRLDSGLGLGATYEPAAMPFAPNPAAESATPATSAGLATRTKPTPQVKAFPGFCLTQSLVSNVGQPTGRDVAIANIEHTRSATPGSASRYPWARLIALPA